MDEETLFKFSYSLIYCFSLLFFLFFKSNVMELKGVWLCPYISVLKAWSYLAKIHAFWCLYLTEL